MRNIEVSDLCGTYVANYSFGTDRLVLNKDSTYSQEVVVRGDTAVYKTSGRWKYDRHDNWVEIENCMIVSDGRGGLRRDFRDPQVGYTLEPVERDFLVGKIRLGPDEGNPYEKVGEKE